MKKHLPFIFLLLIGTAVSAQITQTVLSNNPSTLKWNQINTPHFRILFPKGFDQQGLRMANTLERIRSEEARTMGEVPRKISVVLQNQSSVSNGFVTILPRRSEFYTMPSQDYNFIGTNDWLNMLASHEYRHIVQYQHATRGFNRLVYYIFGSPTLAGLAQAAAPMWFWEGDAVATETAFTHSGRGRIPHFGLVFKTNLLEGRTFNYHKQYLRSYKHNIPDHYVLGYHMVSYLRKRTNDPEIWSKITARSWSVPLIPFAFSNAIKKETGLTVTKLYREMAKDLKASWQKEISAVSLSPFQDITHRRKKAYTDYLYPQPLDDGSVLVMKRGISDIEKFVILKDGAEKKVFIPGPVNDTGMLSADGYRVVWNEYGFDPRWEVKTYSLVKAYDFSTKKKKVIGSKHERLASASISADGSKIVTVRTGTDYKTAVIVLDYSSGKILKEFANPENYFYSMPRWANNGKEIAVLKTTKDGKTISIIDFGSGTEKDVLPVSQENVGYPVLFDNYLFYNSPVSGIDNVYVLKLDTQEKLQVTSSRYGAYNPAVSKDGKFIFYNDQTKNGLDVVKIPFDPAAWKKFEPGPEPEKLYETLVEQEGDPNLLNNVPENQFPITRYSKIKGLINPYAWGLNLETDLTQANLGIASQDILSTTAISAGYNFDINERTGSYKAQISYQGWFPIIDVAASIANRSVSEGNINYEKVVGKDTVTYSQNLTFKWQEKTVEAGLRIPLVTTSSRFSGNITLSNYFGYTSVSGFKNSIDGGGRIVPTEMPQYIFRNYIDHGNLLYNHFTITAFRLLKRSRRDIYSKWGQRIVVEAYTLPTGTFTLFGRNLRGNYSGTQFSFYGTGYFPGLFKHHSVWGYWAYQYSQIDRPSVESNNYTFRNRIPLPRGQSVSRFGEFYSMSANYTMPLWYPDIALGPLLNFQRVRTNFFFDYGFGQSKTLQVSRVYASAGAEIKFDINILRFLPQFDIGFRYTEPLSPKTANSRYEVLIGTFNF